MCPRSRRSALLISLVLASQPARGEDFSKPEARDKYAKAVASILPEGWTVTKTEAGSTPPD